MKNLMRPSGKKRNKQNPAPAETGNGVKTKEINYAID